MRTLGFLCMLAACDSAFGIEHVPHCVAGAFAAGTPVPLDGAYSVEAARFTSDEKVAYLSLCMPDGTGCDLYQSAFSDTTHNFGLFAKLNGLSSTAYDAYPTITPDGHYILFGSQRTDLGIAGTHVYIATAQNGSFEAPVIVPLPAFPMAGTASNEPYALPDNDTIYFNGETGTPGQLYRASGGPPNYGPPELLASLDVVEATENAPVVREDELEIFFASNRDHLDLAPNLLGLDIYSATRASTSEAYGSITHIEALSGDGPDWPVWISPSGCDLFYINKRGSEATLFVTHRQ